MNSDPMMLLQKDAKLHLSKTVFLSRIWRKNIAKATFVSKIEPSKDPLNWAVLEAPKGERGAPGVPGKNGESISGLPGKNGKDGIGSDIKNEKLESSPCLWMARTSSIKRYRRF